MKRSSKQTAEAANPVGVTTSGTLEEAVGAILGAQSSAERQLLLDRFKAMSVAHILAKGDPLVRYQDAYDHLLRWDDSYSRLPALMQLRGHMESSDWWRLLGRQWTGCDNFAAYKEELRQLLLVAPKSVLESMMSEEDLRTWRLQPDEVLVYRGCYANNSDGLSWSLSPDVASGFVKLNRYRQTDSAPLLLHGRVKRDRCVFFTDRDELEVVSPKVTLEHRVELV